MRFRIVHANINVTDLERSIEFYRKALGLHEVKRTKAEDGSFILAYLADDTNTFQIELTWLRDKEGPYDLGDNESHIAFVTDDYEKAHELHKEMGCICYENEAMGLYFIEDPDGYWMEILPQR
jgi:Glyoxalase/Bleomycin resistance protein/Dioxygenase superfamily.